MAYDFPASPTTGQVYQGWTYDGEKWVATGNVPNTAGVIAIQVFTASGFYVPSPSMTSCIVECWGGGGGGGGVTGTAADSRVASGGGAGSYSRSKLTAAQVGTSQTVTIGAAGAGAPASPAIGGAGGTTMFGVLVVANGGTGGAAGTLSVSGGAGGATGTGDFTTPGQRGPSAGGDTTTAQTITVGGDGASSPVGLGGAAGRSSGNAAAGISATSGYAAGGGGACVNKSATSAAGGAGAPGLVVITEYGMTALASGAGLGNVRYDLPQGLTANQQAQARANDGMTKKNYVINGGMQISQENAATVLTASAVYPVDMFSFAGTYGAWQVAQISSLTPAGSPNRVQVKVTTADTAMTGAKYAVLFVAVEGLRMADLKAGTAAAKQITVQFGVKAPAGTYGVSVQNGPAANRSYIAEYTIAAGEANTDVVKSVTLTLNDISGTWVTNNTAGLWVNFTLGVGPTGQGVANSWLAGGFFGTSNQFNFMGTVGNTFELFDVGLYEGSVAPPFMVPDFVSELNMCQRYWLKSYQNAVTPGTNAGGGLVSGVAVATDNIYAAIAFKQRMRASPTVTLYSLAGTLSRWTTTAGVDFANTVAPGFIGENTFSVITSTGLTVGAGYYGHYTASARL